MVVLEWFWFADMIGWEKKYKTPIYQIVSGSTDTETRGQDTQQVGWGRKKCGKWCLTDFAWQPTAGGPWSNNAWCRHQPLAKTFIIIHDCLSPNSTQIFWHLLIECHLIIGDYGWWGKIRSWTLKLRWWCADWKLPVVIITRRHLFGLPPLLCPLWLVLNFIKRPFDTIQSVFILGALAIKW